MLGLAMALFVASPASAGDLLQGEPYYTGLYTGAPLSLDIEPDPFASEPTIRASFSNQILPFHGSMEIERKVDSGVQSSIFETKSSQDVVSGTMNRTDSGIEFNNYMIESQYSQTLEFITSGYSTIVEGSAESSGATFIFEHSLSVEF